MQEDERDVEKGKLWYINTIGTLNMNLIAVGYSNKIQILGIDLG